MKGTIKDRLVKGLINGQYDWRGVANMAIDALDESGQARLLEQLSPPEAPEIEPIHNKHVQVTLDLQESCSQYRIRLGAEEAVAFARGMSPYNRITRAKLEKLFREVHRLVPDKVGFSFQVGNESSLVVYVNIVAVHLGAYFEDPTHLLSLIMLEGRRADADEVSVVEDTAFKKSIRLWWD